MRARCRTVFWALPVSTIWSGLSTDPFGRQRARNSKVDIPMIGEPLTDPEMDFTNEGEPSMRVEGAIVKGTFVVDLSVNVALVGYFAVNLRSVLANVAGVHTPIQLQLWQYLDNATLDPLVLSVNYFIFPTHTSAGETARRLDALRYGYTFKELLDFSNSQNGATSNLGIQVGNIKMEKAKIETRSVTRPVQIRVPEMSHNAGHNAGQNTNPDFPTQEEIDACASINTPCVCAAIETCAWVKQSGDKDYKCMYLGGGVECEHCPIQHACRPDEADLCAAQWDPCACAASNGECFWDDLKLLCKLATGGQNTSCAACSLQDDCGKLEVIKYEPPTGSLLEKRISKHLVVTFDRPIFQERILRQGDVQFACDGSSITDKVPSEAISIEGERLKIDFASVQNTRNKSCNLIVRDGVLRDGSGVGFKGISADEYAFVLGDTVPPIATSFDPKTGTRGWNGESIKITFSETIFLSSTFTANVYSLLDTSGDAVTIGDLVGSLGRATSSSGQRVWVSDKQLALEMATLGLESQRSYSIEITEGALFDKSLNDYPGLMLGNYMFTTGGAFEEANSLAGSAASNSSSLRAVVPVGRSENRRPELFSHLLLAWALLFYYA